jgi:single-strand DNA-binding protein
MNCFFGIGRLTADPETRYTQGNNPMAVSRYNLAVDRRTKKDGEQGADFLRCVAFGKSAEFAEKYLSKGMKIAIRGHVQTGSYTDKDGKKVYTTDIVVDEHEFCESKKAANESQQSQPEPMPDNDGFMHIPDDIDAELPFN